MSRLVRWFVETFFPRFYCEKYGHDFIFDQAHYAKPFMFYNAETQRYYSILLITDPIPITDEAWLINELKGEAENSFMLEDNSRIKIPRRRFVVGTKCKRCGRYVSLTDDEYNPSLH